jgi:DNA-binding HxlR family transcriptional regulator
MKPRELYFRSDCPISAALDMLGDKWSLLIIRDMALRGKTSYKEFAEGTEKIATNILADRLARLEATEIITRQKNPLNKVKVVYRLTEKGIDLVPLLIDMLVWTETYHEVDERTAEFARLARADREGVIRNIVGRLRLAASHKS